MEVEGFWWCPQLCSDTIYYIPLGGNACFGGEGAWAQPYISNSKQVYGHKEC